MKLAEAREKQCPVLSIHPDGFIQCKTTDCMGWTFVDAGVEFVRTPAERRPQGEGWKAGPVRDGVVSWLRPMDPEKRNGCCAFMQQAHVTHIDTRQDYARMLQPEEMEQ